MSEPVAKQIPGFLPTLTEVVSLPPDVELRIGPLPGAELAKAAPLSDAELAERALQQLPGVLAPQLNEILNRLVQEQMRALAPRLQQEVEQAVRQALARTVRPSGSGSP